MEYEYWTDNWETPRKEEKEDEQNRRITKALEGLRCPKWPVEKEERGNEATTF